MKHQELKNKLLSNKKIALEYSQVDLSYEIGRTIKELRIKSGFTQLELASKINTKQSSIARLENGSAGLPSLIFLLKIAQVTGHKMEMPRFSAKISLKEANCLTKQ